MTKHDPEALDRALATLAEAVAVARDCFLMGDDEEGRKAFMQSIDMVTLATHQIKLRNKSRYEP